jgi:hypothetical protein
MGASGNPPNEVTCGLVTWSLGRGNAVLPRQGGELGRNSGTGAPDEYFRTNVLVTPGGIFNQA